MECGERRFVEVENAAGVPPPLIAFAGVGVVALAGLSRSSCWRSACYGHMFPGDEGEAAELLNAYLERADTAAQRITA
jgi:hypothetical protein